MKKIVGLSKPVFFLGLVSLFTDLSTEMVYPILPLFLANIIGASTAFIGLIEGIAESTASLLKVFSGWISDKFGQRKKLILAGYGFSTVTKPFFALATTGYQVLGLRFLDRLGKGIRGAPRDAMIADVTEPSERGRAFGYHRAMDTVGAVIGPSLAFLFLAVLHDSYRSLFLIASIPAFIAVAIIVFAVKEKKHDIFSAGINQKTASDTLPKEKQKLPKEFIVLLVIMGIFTLGNSSDAFLILRAQGTGVDVKFIPLLWLMFNLTYTLISVPAGILSDKIGRRKIIIIGFAVYAFSYLGFAFASKWWQALLLFCIYGTYYGMTDGVVRAYISDIIPTNIRATSFGIYNFVVGVLLFPANLLLGLIWKYSGHEAAFITGAAIAGVAVISFALYTSRIKSSTDRPVL